MKHVFLLLAFLLPCGAGAVTLADCDSKPYEVTVKNGGHERKVTLTPTGGNIQEYGPVVSFALDGQPPVVSWHPDEEYCVWSGKITIQRRSAFAFSAAAGKLAALMTGAYAPLILPFLAWLVSLLGTALALPLLKKLRVMDIPGARSNHGTPTPRGGGIAMIVSALFFLQWEHISLASTMAALLLFNISFMDDIEPQPVRVRLMAQIIALLFALHRPIIAALHGGHLPLTRLFPDNVPLYFEAGFMLLAWLWYINLTNFMDGIDGITSLQTIFTCVGICLVCAVSPPGVLPELAAQASILAAAALGFYAFNRSPAKLFMGDAGSIPLGFLTGYLLLRLAICGHWLSALILPAYYLSDATITLLRRLMHGEKIWQAHSTHAYQQAVRSGLSHAQVVGRISLLNMALVVLAMLATVNMIAGVAALAAAYFLTACLIRYFIHGVRP